MRCSPGHYRQTLRLRENPGRSGLRWRGFFHGAPQYLKPATVLVANRGGVAPVPTQKNNFTRAEGHQGDAAFGGVPVDADRSFRQRRRQYPRGEPIIRQPVLVLGKGRSVRPGRSTQQFGRKTVHQIEAPDRIHKSQWPRLIVICADEHNHSSARNKTLQRITTSWT